MINSVHTIDEKIKLCGMPPTLRVWDIPEEYPSLSDHYVDAQNSKNTQAAISGWSIKNLLADNELMKAAKSEWKRVNEDHQLLNLLGTRQELDEEVEWFVLVSLRWCDTKHFHFMK